MTTTTETAITTRTTHDEAKAAMTAAAEACLAGDPDAVRLAEEALKALREAQDGDINQGDGHGE